MIKLLPILLIALVYLTPLYPVYAQDTASSSAIMTRPKIKGLIGKDKVASRAAIIKGKLAKFKDKVKANRVENINNNLNVINKRRTNSMAQALEKMSQILEKLKTKAGEAVAAGKDVSELNSAITSAEVEWAEADAAVKAQMENDYSIDVNKESTVKEDAATARNSLRTDLKSAHTQVVEARQALSNAIQTAVSSMQGGNSGTQ